MKCNDFPLLVLCLNCSLLSLFVNRSCGGVGNLCEDGKFFDRSKQQYVPCHECKEEIQECLSCCKINPDSQDERSNTTKFSSSKSHLHPQDTSNQKIKKSSSSAEDYELLPNILVVSTVSFFIVASLLILLLVIVKSSTSCCAEAAEQATGDSQRSDIVMEVVMMEPVTDSTDEIASNGRSADMDTNAVDDSQTGSEMSC